MVPTQEHTRLVGHCLGISIILYINFNFLNYIKSSQFIISRNFTSLLRKIYRKINKKFTKHPKTFICVLTIGFLCGLKCERHIFIQPISSGVKTALRCTPVLINEPIGRVKFSKGSCGYLIMSRQSWKIFENESPIHVLPVLNLREHLWLHEMRGWHYTVDYINFFYSSIDLIRITMNSDTLIVSLESASILQRLIEPSKG